MSHYAYLEKCQVAVQSAPYVHRLVFRCLEWHTLALAPLNLMMSLEAIIAINNQAAAEAEKKRLSPFVPSGPDATNDWPPFPFPSLGRVPDGWEVAETFFVDATGHGRQGEPALTIEEFRSQIFNNITDHPDHGYAIIEEGPFQVIVAALQRTRHDVANRLKS